MQKTPEDRFAQEIAHILGRANAMKSEFDRAADYYDVWVLNSLAYLPVLLTLLLGFSSHGPQYGHLHLNL